MNPKIKYLRLVLALALALSALGVSASNALANKPDQYEVLWWPMYSIMTDVCTFPVNVESYVHFQGTDYYVNGTLTRTKWHGDEQDKFINPDNGKTLVGEPFTFNIEWTYDSNSQLVKFYADGVVEKVWLPDGSLFISAGRIDWMTHPGIFVLSADKGNPGNIAAFCAALAP